MITLQQGDVRFIYRVVGVGLHEGRVLAHRDEGEDFWALPGGRGELMEPSPDTLRREMQEEIDADVEVERLLWVVENFFEYQGLKHHEVGFYYLMCFPPGSPVLQRGDSFIGDEDGKPMIFDWLPLSRLGEITLYPSFLRTALQSLPAHPVHVVHHDAAEE